MSRISYRRIEQLPLPLARIDFVARTVELTRQLPAQPQADLGTRLWCAARDLRLSAEAAAEFLALHPSHRLPVREAHARFATAAWWFARNDITQEMEPL